MTVLWAHLKIRFVQLFKEPGYVLSTMVFPALFFLIFALPNADTKERANFLLGSFSVFAVLGVCFFQFGVYYAQELRSGWQQFLSTLPAAPGCFFLSQWISAVVCATLSSLVVYITILLSTDATTGVLKWLTMVGVLILGAIPFALFSAAVARWVTPTSALPTFNLLYILSSFAGGLWLPPNALPIKVEKLSRMLPTRHFGEIVWQLSLDQAIDWKYALYLTLFMLLALGLLALPRTLQRPVR